MSQSGVRRVLTPRPVVVYTAPDFFLNPMGTANPAGFVVSEE